MLDALYADLLNNNLNKLTDEGYIGELDHYLLSSENPFEVSDETNSRIFQMLKEIGDNKAFFNNVLDTVKSYQHPTHHNLHGTVLFPLWRNLCELDLHNNQSEKLAEDLYILLTNSTSSKMQTDLLKILHDELCESLSSIGLHAFIMQYQYDIYHPFHTYILNSVPDSPQLIKMLNNTDFKEYLIRDFEDSEYPYSDIVLYLHNLTKLPSDHGLKKLASEHLINETLEALKVKDESIELDYCYEDYEAYTGVLRSLLIDHPDEYFELITTHQHESVGNDNPGHNKLEYLTAALVKDQEITIPQDQHDQWLQILDCSNQTKAEEFKSITDQIYPARKQSKHKQQSDTLSL